MPTKNDSVFKDPESKRIVVPVPNVGAINDIDTQHSLYDNIIETSDNSLLDLSKFNSFTNISQTRDNLYNMIDMMSEDPIIAVAINIYSADATEPNESGHIIWADGDDPRAVGEVNHILDQINADKNSFEWVHSLVKYGDLYLRLYRNSEYNGDLFEKKEDKNKLNESLDESVILKAYKSNDKYAEYIEMHKNPAEMFDLKRFGKSVGYIRSHIIPTNQAVDYTNNYQTLLNNYRFNAGDVDLYPATEFVHAYLPDTSSRLTEEVSIIANDVDKKYTYTVKRGKSILYNSFKIWRELSLLENSVLINRITKSSKINAIHVEVGDMNMPDVKKLLQRIKQMVEQKMSLNLNNSMNNYNDPGPINNTIYVPTHEGKGKLEPIDLSNAGPIADAMTDVDYFKKKLFGSLGIPKQYLGDTDESAGFSGGESLALVSSQYAKTVKAIQNAYCQAITDAVNLILYDKGMNQYINNFTIKMQPPSTKEDKDRRDGANAALGVIREVMSLIGDAGIEDAKDKLEILKSMLGNVITETDIVGKIQEVIDRLNQQPSDEDMSADLGGDLGGDFGGADFGDTSGGEELPTAPVDLTGEPGSSVSMESPEEPQEDFTSGEGEELLTEDGDDLPTWEDLGMSFDEYKK